MRVAVLGGGLQGACVAMELASAGISVDLYDKNDRFLTQASAQNEGKIHLGYVYANDRTLNTARTMVKGAISFLPLLRRWLGGVVDSIPVSEPFNYVVHTASQLNIEEIESHFKSSQEIAVQESKAFPVDYFGADYRMIPARLSESQCDALYDRRLTAAAFKTAEVGIDPEFLAALVRRRLEADPMINTMLQTRVMSVSPHNQSVAVAFESNGEELNERYDQVVNTLWDGRLAIDRTAGLEPDRQWMYRIKHYLRVRAPGVAASLPCTTMVLGAFGDIVNYGNGEAYLSWYPAGMRGVSSDFSPPKWPLILDQQTSMEVRNAILAGLVGIVPTVANLIPENIGLWEVKAGIIFAWGQTDINDPASVLHERHAIGPQSVGRYHTVDTGKLTTAPLFGKMVADRILNRG